ncbi:MULTISPECIES: tRNA (adenosine(37)-N6)-threonylcarbamoyltransferase complex ATPase subunit type 1 TsaE [Arthrobacter]|uniref:tRNA threonylcarbamoyladenosine biosynthesis protein TsaE n=2 Tax=Arthrobacter TaxID=1663 RepID=A0ABU9KMQ2_9MICC|nr:tRNA (adenosine(37)-N6)-threonylcarbamoyltransferase complex ATPase subunit type 1 TsaE [Arthrobacter sp. YJM1]MDP5228019.1 tRNA (adenosine(37)-N6)-threonylcarbamoyltransferase complex ATPase subunit type 1 TsaE [Arthrobacter sp. YJM1]
MSRPLWTAVFQVADVDQTQDLAVRIAQSLRAGDLLILSGGLGAGKTTFTQGLGRGLGVREGIISPTFVLARQHPNLPDGPRPGGPDLVHVDAYRLGSAEELEDIDLEETLDTSVTVVEWGRDRAEQLAASRLEIELERPRGGDETTGEIVLDFEDEDEPRTITVTAFGERWEQAPEWAVDGIAVPQEGQQ